MSDDNQDRVPYRDKPLSGNDIQRTLRSDARIGEGAVLSYLDASGRMLALTGDAEAPYVKLIQQAPALIAVSTIPTAAASGVLVASLIAAELHEVWAIDARDQSTLPAARWLQLFDKNAAPTAGDVPSYAAIKLCPTSSMDFVEAPLQFNTGIVLAISTTPNIYTAIVAATDFAITARVLARS